jgi:molecular chaperone DnaK (HSP70)
MKTRQSIEKQMFVISEEERSNLKSVIEDINQIINKKTVNEETIRKFTNSITLLETLKENYMWRMIRAAKQNHMLD